MAGPNSRKRGSSERLHNSFVGRLGIILGGSNTRDEGRSKAGTRSRFEKL